MSSFTGTNESLCIRKSPLPVTTDNSTYMNMPSAIKGEINYGILRSIACDAFQTRAYDVIMCNDTSYSYDLFRIRVRCENMLMTRFEHARIM